MATMIEAPWTAEDWARAGLEYDANAAAYHEAGHAIALLEYFDSRMLDYATIEPCSRRRPDGSICDIFGHLSVKERLRTSPNIEGLAVFYLAGAAAESKAFGFGRDIHDIDAACEAARDHCAAQGIDLAIFVLDRKADAERLLVSRWADVTALAAALVERRTLTGREVARLIAGQVCQNVRLCG